MTGAAQREIDGQDAARAASAAPPEEGITQRAARGSAWVVAGYGASQVIRFGSNLVLARVLFPKAFGLTMLLSVFLTGLQMFSDLGVGTAIIQHDRDDDAFVDTAWTVQIVRGLLLWAVTLALTWPYATLYGEPALLWMLPVAGVTAAIDGFMSTAIHTANRELRMRKLLVFELSVQVLSTVITIVGAWLTRSVTALLVGMVAVSVLRTPLSHVMLGGRRNRLRWEPEAAASLLHFGKWVFASSIVTFLAQQGDRLVFGKLLPLARLGVYNVALTLCEAPSALIGSLALKVFFPLFSELRRTSPDLDGAYRKATAAVALLSGAGALGLIVAGPFLVSVLYDSRYAEATWIVRLLAFGIWWTSLVHLTASVVLASGRVKWLAAANAARLVWLVAAVPLTFSWVGFDAAIVAVVLAEVPRYAVLGLACRADGLHVFRSDLARTAMFAAAVAAALLTVKALGNARLLGVVLGGAVGLVVWIAANREAFRWYLEKARAALARRGAS
jgi:O-antigen/teichoic acid export membrane protein